MSDNADELPSAYLRDVLVRASSVAVPAFERHEAYLLQLRGTPPELILRDRNVSEAIKKAEQYSAPSVEEHLLDFDWPFSDATVKSLSMRLRGMESALVLGAPSIALSLRSKPFDVRKLLVIDRNPFRGGEGSSQLDLRFDDLPDRHEPFDVCIFDAPWYPTDLARWLWQAIQAVRMNGTVLFSLWPELTRPTAKVELINILDSFSNLGDVSIDEGAISYSVPCFERWSYARLGISLSHPWRTGDLVTLIKKTAWGAPAPHQHLKAVGGGTAF